MINIDDGGLEMIGTKGTINTNTTLKDNLRAQVARDIQKMKNNERGINHGE